ncbi:MAG TPA: hypothetical protein VN894_03460 [Polyangiaceae bacterium]|nr:hypothetical protein [Polyangiaceae bacterium]
MSPTHPLPPKKDVALAFLERSSVYVHLDPRPASVLVPAKFKTQPKLILQVGLNMALPILDLRLDDEGIGCTLSFDRKPFFCVVPWASVYAMVGDDGRAMVWPDDVPAEVSLQAQPRAVVARDPKDGAAPDSPADGGQVVEATKPRRPRKGPVLAAVSDAGGQDRAAKAPRKSVRPIEGGERAPQAARAIAPRPGVAPAPAPAPRSVAGGARKRKRDLPPYLRVVK